MQVMQIPTGKAGSGMTEGANHATEEDGDERRDKRCKPFRGIGRRLFDEGKRNCFPLTGKQNRKRQQGCYKYQRVMSRHTSLGLKKGTIPALATIPCLCNKAVGSRECAILEME